MIAEVLGEQGLIVLAILLVFMFGGSKLPELARSLGRAKKEFHDGVAEGDAAAKANSTKPGTTEGSSAFGN